MSALLRGITWGHTRGYVPLVAAAQRYTELHPDVDIAWEKRSLKAFEAFPIEKLAADYDLLVIDHPFIGFAAEHGVFLPLDQYLPAEFLRDQAAHSVGRSHASYVWADRSWALAIDAAAPVAAWRPDLMERHGLRPPATWEDLLALAQTGAVEIPAAPVNCLMTFYGLCLAAGETPFAAGERLVVAGETPSGAPIRVVSEPTGVAALRLLSALVSRCDPACLGRNPIRSLERLASAGNDRVVYAPFPYGYSNYAREGYAERVLRFGDLPAFGDRGPIVTTLGGTGLAVSARTRHPAEAAGYAAFVAAPETQRTLYVRSGGQPGHRAAWLDEENNRITGGYFRATLPVLDRAFVRPRYPGHLHGFQEPAGPLLHRYLRRELTERQTLGELDTLYRASEPAALNSRT